MLTLTSSAGVTAIAVEFLAGVVAFVEFRSAVMLSLSVDTRKRILSCSASDTSTQQDEGRASSISSAVGQHAQPRHQSRLRSYNQRPINRQNRFLTNNVL